MKVLFSNLHDQQPAPSKVFGRRLREWRAERGLSQTQLAAAVTEAGQPLSKAALLRIENGTRELKLDEAIVLAQVLRVPFADLLEPPRDRLVALTNSVAVDGDGMRRWLVTGEPIRVWPEKIETPQDHQLVAAYLADLAVDVVNAEIHAAMTKEMEPRKAAWSRMIDARKRAYVQAKKGTDAS
jgi:transcriptional regulator with XRE-family HTH domain